MSSTRFTLVPAADSALHDASDVRFSLKDSRLFAPLFALSVITLLVADALLHGSTEGIAEVTAVTSAFTALYSVSWKLRHRYPRSSNSIRAFAPILMYGLIYGFIHAVMTGARPSDAHLVDAALLRIDEWMFGVNPVVWMGAHGHPLLTDLLYLCYFSYYFGMPVLLVLMFRGNRARDFFQVQSVMVAGWYGALLSYALFPALGPCRWIADELPVLTGLLPTTQWIQAFLDANLTPVVRDCVPSMHTAITLLTLAYARRFQPMYFRIFLLPGIGIIIATMYTQAHYVIDVLLGVAVAAVLYGVMEKWKRSAGSV
ncbi:MAG: phosphatase PAP2 family protein [Bacteroidia bacterium]|nr:phosphatase PAP2 family protein [Bacteroidia bacterium]